MALRLPRVHNSLAGTQGADQMTLTPDRMRRRASRSGGLSAARCDETNMFYAAVIAIVATIDQSMFLHR